MMRVQNRRQFMVMSGIVAFALVFVLSGCDKTVAPTLDNPYDSESASYVAFPELTTLVVTQVSTTQAESGGSFGNDYGSEVSAKGVCWAEQGAVSGLPVVGENCTDEGGGFDAFVSMMTGLAPGVSYVVRSYATNTDGTVYGGEQEFEQKTWTRDTNTELVELVNPTTGVTWMDRNLGASRVATSSTDSQAYGDLYQWGRSADGNEKRTSSTRSTRSSSDQPGHGDFITTSSSPYDWRSPQNNNLWQGLNGVNNPCPAGYRVPTAAEWEAERQSWSSNNSAGAYTSPLKLPVAGRRTYVDGSLFNVGSFGFYWSSSVDGTSASFLYFLSSYAFVSSYYRAYGFSVRCLED